MTFYEEMQGVASEVLREFKQGKIQYVKKVPGSGPAHNPGPGTEALFDLGAAARGVSFQFVDKTNIVASDLQLTMAVRPDVTPDMAGFIDMDDVRYKIKAVHAIPPAGVPVAYRIIFGK